MYVQVGEFLVSWIIRTVPQTRFSCNAFFSKNKIRTMQGIGYVFVQQIVLQSSLHLVYFLISMVYFLRVINWEQWCLKQSYIFLAWRWKIFWLPVWVEYFDVHFVVLRCVCLLERFWLNLQNPFNYFEK